MAKTNVFSKKWNLIEKAIDECRKNTCAHLCSELHVRLYQHLSVEFTKENEKIRPHSLETHYPLIKIRNARILENLTFVFWTELFHFTHCTRMRSPG
jgi:hypothetical protein